MKDRVQVAVVSLCVGVIVGVLFTTFISPLLLPQVPVVNGSASGLTLYTGEEVRFGGDAVIKAVYGGATRTYGSYFHPVLYVWYSDGTQATLFLDKGSTVVLDEFYTVISITHSKVVLEG